MIKPVAHTYQRAFAGLSRETWLLSLIMLVNRSGTMVLPFMSLYLTSPEMGYTIGQSGWVIGIFGAGAFAGAWLGGKLTDRWGFYPVQLVTLAGGGVLFLVLGQMKSYPLICLFTFLLSFVNEAFRPANSTAIAFYSKEENRTRSYALNRLAINMGWAVGSGLGGVLAHIDFVWLFWVDGCTNLGAAGMLWWLLKPAGPVRKTKKDTGYKRGPSALSDPVYLRFILFTCLFAACFFQLFNNLPLYFEKDLALSKPLIGLIMASNGVIIALIEMVLIYRLEGRRKNTTYISLGVLICGFAFMILNWPGAGALAAMAMMTLITFGEILAMPFMNSYWISRTVPENRGQYAAYYTMAWSLAQSLGPLTGAQIAQHFSFQALWWGLGAICLLLAFAFRKLL